MQPESLKNQAQGESAAEVSPGGVPGPQVDVVIPVYSGFEATRLCLESVLANPQNTTHEVIVVDDRGPDPAISDYLRGLEAAGSITLMVNKANIGFVDSANLGMMLHPDRDVVLLNSDTEVSGDWLDRLRAAALSAPRVATVTPFSNNGTLASYPRYMSVNGLPAGMDTAGMDALFREMNAGRYVEIPTAVGFCTYITREALEAAGYLDSLHFGRGYGEENDFSLRASAAGFRHLLAGDTFVMHQGGESFGEQAGSLSAAAQEVLRERHPGYEALVQEHCTRDPERPLRRRVDLARLSRSPAGKLLFITHRLGGGTEKHIQGLVRLLEPDWEVLVLRPAGAGQVSLEWARAGEEFSAYFQLPGEFERLAELLKSLGVSRIHVHHAVEHEPEVLELPSSAALDVPFDITIHDYHLVCPFTNLVREDGDYCGEPSVAGCELCYASRRSSGELGVRERRARASKLLAAADRVIVPSQDVLERMQRYFPGIDFTLLPHPEEETDPFPLSPPTDETEIRVLVLGEMSPAKGLRLMEACADDAKKRGLPLSFRVLGRPLARVRQEPEVPLRFSGPYSDGQLMQLIAGQRPHVIFFPARWPETYSFTLSAAIRTGLPIAAPRIGSFPERLQDYPAAHLMDWDTAAGAWNDLFLSMSTELIAGGHGP